MSSSNPLSQSWLIRFNPLIAFSSRQKGVDLKRSVNVNRIVHLHGSYRLFDWMNKVAVIAKTSDAVA